MTDSLAKDGKLLPLAGTILMSPTSAVGIGDGGFHRRLEHKLKAGESHEQLLLSLRDVCQRFPETHETVKWGNPTFVAGKKMFAVLDHYEGSVCVAFRADATNTPLVTIDPMIFPAPYAAKRGWWCLRADKTIPRRKLETLIESSYRLVALKRMLTAFENQ